MGKRVKKIAMLSKMKRYGTILFLLVEVLYFSIAVPDIFPTFSNLLNVTSQMVLLFVVSAGLTFPLVMGDFDLSIGYLGSLVGMIVAGQMDVWGVFPSIMIGVAIGLAVGLFNGFVVAKIGITSIIATLGTGSILVGCNWLYGEGMSQFAGIPPAFLNIARGKFLGVSNMIIYMGLLFLFCWLLLNSTKLGRQMYAIGGNAEAARLSGINIQRCRFIGFILCSLLATFAGILLASRMGGGNPQGADGFLLEALTAVFLGAATLKIGQFDVQGTFIGILIMAVAANGFTIMDIPFYWQNITYGFILIVAVGVSGLRTSFKL